MEFRVRMVREVRIPGNTGPQNAMYALQKILNAMRPPWLSIGGQMKRYELPWMWYPYDTPLAVHCEHSGIPYIIGPQVLFADSRYPGCNPPERVILSGRFCRGFVTESEWYKQLILEAKSPENPAPVVAIPTPVDPQPEPPLPYVRDLLIYRKSGVSDELVDALHSRYNSHVLTYGCFRREDLYQLARTSRACVYLSDDDRGPVALAEILLAGCPCVGVPRGAPWIHDGQTGYLIQKFTLDAIQKALEPCMEMSRDAVRTVARRMFDPGDIGQQYIEALDKFRRN